MLENLYYSVTGKVHPIPTYAHLIQAMVARGRITAMDTAAALALDGVLFVLTHQNAPGWPPIATGSVEYQAEKHNVRLRADSGDLYTPETMNPALVTDTADGDVAAALAAAPVTVDETYATPAEYHNPIEPHSTAAIWSGDGDAGHLTVYDSNQGASRIQTELALVFGLDPGQVTVISPFVGGAFGSKTRPKGHHVVAVLAAKRLRAVRSSLRSAVGRCSRARTTRSRRPRGSRNSLSRQRSAPAPCMPPRTGVPPTAWQHSMSPSRRSCGHQAKRPGCSH
jgi:CO/xanthine dehydrogenase Mo-binding subunit